jgi:hypothetical protein
MEALVALQRYEILFVCSSLDEVMAMGARLANPKYKGAWLIS